MSAEQVRYRLRVAGVVQGVGFRPFVHALAGRLALSGLVGNDASGVFIEVEGDPDTVSRFQETLRREAPPLAVIERIALEALPPRGGRGFAIVTSRGDGSRRTLISPDTATCDDCLRELFDPADRRYRYPFVNCTNCGPRFTIIRDVPYDRPYTTMAGFPMCAACAAEYRDPADRRFHAQPVCCPACGPVLRLSGPGGAEVPGDPVEAAAELLRAGRIVAIKGLGGYHLAVDAGAEAAARTLRSRKHREDRPFAVMVSGLAAARLLCEVDEPAAAALTGAARPIVLLPRRPGVPVAAAVAPGNRELGLLLPYTPVHHLLARALAGPMVLTSGNVSDEPICHDDAEAFDRLRGIADAFLTHDRPIHMRTDDSVVRVVAGRALPIRRARGEAPRPLPLPRPAGRPLLAVGAELKSTFCLARGAHAFVSHHIGDLENYETFRSFTTGIEHYRRLFDITPELVAHDLHPEYLSTKYALGLPDAEPPGVELLGVQHHHAHIASCLADSGETGPVIGVALDGLGYGTDGTLWGGEILVADLGGFTRAGHLAPVALPGGTAAIREPWRMAAAHLTAAGAPSADLAVRERNAARWDPVAALAGSRLGAPVTSSAGRLFDAVAALLGVRDTVTYEGQAAIELEQLADRGTGDGYPGRITDGDPFLMEGTDLVLAAADDLRAAVPVPVIAARFHHGVAALILGACTRVRTASGLRTVALSGGVFQNRLLLERTVPALERRGFRVLTHRRVPPNDGGISLGQAAIACREG
ncbi:carbamoyltransferase HypF [Actinomadura scrupuli]|uniref:carbamoyltransferase HypF n=1 Tax=Actinomadura scrupuli TaxID=559629 RepID=UPI003D9709D4